MRTAHPCHDLVAALIVKSRQDAGTRSPSSWCPWRVPLEHDDAHPRSFTFTRDTAPLPR